MSEGIWFPKPLSLGLCLLAAWSGAAAVPPPEQLLPADTLGVVSIAEYPRAKRQAAAGAAGRLWHDPALKPFRDKFEAKFKTGLLAPLERLCGLTFADFEALAQGQVTLALTANGWAGQPGQRPGFLLLVDVKDKSEALKAKLAALRKTWLDQGKPLRTEKIGDLDFSVLTVSADEVGKVFDQAFPPPAGTEPPPKPAAPPQNLQWFIGQSESMLILGDAAAEIEKVLARQAAGGLPSLAGQAGFAAHYEPMFRDAPAYGWLNLKTLLQNLVQSLDAATNAPALGALKPGRVLAALGLNELQSLAWSVRDGAEGPLSTLVADFPAANRQGLLKLLAFAAKDASPPSFVPAEVARFRRWRWDLGKSWSTLEAMLVDINAQYGTVIKLLDLVGKDKDPNYDIRKSLFGNLGDDVITCEKSPRKLTFDELDAPPKLYLLSSPRPEQVVLALKVLAGSLVPPPVGKLKEREFLGRKLYSVTMPALFGAEGEKPAEQTLNFAASGAYVAISADAPMFEALLRNTPGKALRDTPGFAAAAAQVGGTSTGLFGYTNQRETWRARWETLRRESGSAPNLLGAGTLAGRLGVAPPNRPFKDWLDFTLLPPFDQVAQYFTFAVWSGQLTPDGLTVKWFSPRPPELKE